MGNFHIKDLRYGFAAFKEEKKYSKSFSNLGILK